MRTVRRLGVVILLFAALTGCDSEQPARVETVLASLNVTAANAQTEALEVWNLIEDSDNDGQPDDGQVYLWCEGPTGQALIPSSVPWGYSVEISVIRSGTTVAEILTSEEATDDTFNLTDYGPINPIVGVTPSDPPFACRHDSTGNEIANQNFCTVNHSLLVNTRIFTFSSPRRMPATANELMNHVDSPLSSLLGSDFGTGLCSTGTPGPSQLDGVPLPYTLDLHRGDTIIVKARMTLNALDGTGLATVLRQNPNAIAGRLKIDGREVIVQGTPAGDAISFSYTFR